MQVLSTPEGQIKLTSACRLMNEALDILDELGEAGDVGSHLDLAIARLENHLGFDSPGVSGTLALKAALEDELSTRSATAATRCPWELHPV